MKAYNIAHLRHYDHIRMIHLYTEEFDEISIFLTMQQLAFMEAYDGVVFANIEMPCLICIVQDEKVLMHFGGGDWHEAHFSRDALYEIDTEGNHHNYVPICFDKSQLMLKPNNHLRVL